MKKFVLIMALLLASSTIFAQIKISGDMTMRPRMDISDNGDFGSRSEDYYYMYRARLNFDANIGDGWFAKMQLAHGGFGAFAFSGFTRTESRIPFSVDGAIRPGVHFMEMYFGRNTDNYGFIGGIIPINAVANPIYDLHYYPERMVDIPFAIFSANGALGFDAYYKLGGGKLGVRALVDNNEGKYVENANGDELQNTNDCYTYGLDYSFNVADFTLQPIVLAAFANDSTRAPMTYGLNLSSPAFGGFKLHGSFYMSSQDNKGTTEYDATFFRVKLTGKVGPGSLLAWYGIMKRSDKLVGGEVDHDFTDLWVMYKIPVYKSDKGSVVLAPTYRRATEKADNLKDYMRNKIELTAIISF